MLKAKKKLFCNVILIEKTKKFCDFDNFFFFETVPKDAVLIGHNVARHITRLGLKKGVDFRCSLDLTDCWRVWNKNFMVSFLKNKNTKRKRK